MIYTRIYESDLERLWSLSTSMTRELTLALVYRDGGTRIVAHITEETLKQLLDEGLKAELTSEKMVELIKAHLQHAARVQV